MKTVLPCSRWFRWPADITPRRRELPLPPKYLRPFSGVGVAATMAYPSEGRNPNGAAPCFGRVCAAGLIRSADVDTPRVADDTKPPSQCGFTADETLFHSDPFHCNC